MLLNNLIYISLCSVTLPTFLRPPVFISFLPCYSPVICPSVVLLRHIIDPPKPAGEEYNEYIIIIEVQCQYSKFHSPLAVAHALDICLHPFGLRLPI